MAGILCAVASCNHQDAPRPVTSTQPDADDSSSRTAGKPDASGDICHVPLPEKPPPEAEPAPNCPPAPTSDFDLPNGFVIFKDAPSDPRVHVEIAKTPEHRERGLMYREQLAADAGMLFLWQQDRVRSFWMRNTCLPLDMLFITADGTIAGIVEQVPTMNDEPRSIECPVRYVLEVPAGYSRKHGIAPLQKVELDL